MKRAIKKLREELIDGMVEYVQDDEDGVVTYTQPDIDRCTKILDDFLGQLEAVPKTNKSEFITKAVKSVVIKLNKLNDACEGGLIETDQREQLCEIIITAARNAGLAVDDEDVTEEWREW